MALIQREAVSSWWKSSAGSQSRDIAKEAYESALQHLKDSQQLHSRDQKPLWSGTSASIEEVLELVEHTKANYDGLSPKRKKVGKCLADISERIMNYSAVLDMLAQHHPEYVSLAWGAAKFVLIGVLNYAELVVKFSRAFTEIAEALPLVALNAELYQTDRMRDSIAVLYAQIMRFWQRAITWYSSSFLRRTWEGILNPYDIKYKDIIDEIKASMGNVKTIADAARGAETRDMHILLSQMKKQHENDMNEIRSLKEVITRMAEGGLKHENYLKQILEVTTSNKSISQDMRLNIIEMKPLVSDIHFYTSETHMRMVIGSIAPKTSPEKLLLKGQSLAKRGQPGDTIQNLQALASRIGQWYLAKASATIIIQAAPRAQSHARDLAVDAIAYLRGKGKPVFFALSQRSTEDGVSLVDICKNLVHQSLNHQADFVRQNPKRFQFSALNDSHTEREWMALLGLILATIPQSFVIIETEDLFKTYNGDSAWLPRLLGLLKTLSGTVAGNGSVVKVMLVNNRRTPHETAGQAVDSSLIVHTIQQQVIPMRSRQRVANTATHRTIWTKLDSKSRR